MKQELNPQKYVDQINEIKEQAKKAAIELLKNNPNGRYIYEGEDDVFAEESFFDTATGDDEVINIIAVGLDANDHLIFKASDSYGNDYEDGEWFEFDQFITPYAEVYKFVAMNLEFAKEESELEDDEDD